MHDQREGTVVVAVTLYSRPSKKGRKREKVGGEERTTKKFFLSFLFSSPREKKEKFFFGLPTFPSTFAGVYLRYADAHGTLARDKAEGESDKVVLSPSLQFPRSPHSPMFKRHGKVPCN